MLKRKSGHWKMRNPTYRYEGEIPVFEGVYIQPDCTIKYKVSLTTDWLFMQKDGLLQESTLYLRKNSLEFEQAVKDFAMGFKLDSTQLRLNKPSTLNIVLKNKYIINKTWEAEAVIEGNKVSIEFEAKVCETKINTINIMGKFGLQFSAEIFFHPHHPQYPLPAADVNWEQVWEEALTGLKIVGAIVLVLAIRLYQFATGLWFFIMDPIYDDPYLMGPNQMCKIDQAKQEKDKGDV